MKEGQMAAGSKPINPVDNVEPTPEVEAKVEEVAPVEDKATTPGNDLSAKFEQMMTANQAMIGKQSNEIGALRAQLTEMNKQPEGPGEEQQLVDIYQKMDSGEIEIQDGMQQALALNSNMTVAKVMQQVTEQQRQGDISKAQTSFMQKNPDYQVIQSSGALQPYLDEDPLMDDYTAFHKFKADEKAAQVTTEWEAKVEAAKEMGAKLAKGAETAGGKVLGKQGGTANAPQVTKPFKNNNEATAAMLKTLKGLRSATPG